MDYSTIHPEIWTGETGSKLHGDPAAQVLYAYLMTCRHRNQIGLYYLPLSYIVDDTGLGLATVTEKLEKLSSIGFCKYDQPRKLVWVIKMAPKQTSRSPKAVTGAVGLLNKTPDSPLKRELVALYGPGLSRLHTLSIPYPEAADTLSIGDTPVLPIHSNSEQSNSEQISDPPNPPGGGDESGVSELDSPPANDSQPPDRSDTGTFRRDAPLSGSHSSDFDLALGEAAEALRWKPRPEIGHQMRGKIMQRCREHAHETGKTFLDACREIARDGLVLARSTTKSPATALLEVEPGRPPPRRDSRGRPERAAATTGKDFADAASLEEQLGRIGAKS